MVGSMEYSSHILKQNKFPSFYNSMAITQSDLPSLKPNFFSTDVFIFSPLIHSHQILMGLLLPVNH